jgi:Ti-type conjugative transfer relaxase TraA
MAIYHLSMKPLSRGSGRSAVAAAAYRAAEVLENERDGVVHDFSKRSGVEHAEIVLPHGVPADWARDRLALWNAAEASEKRRDARVAREIEVALPHELSAEQRLDLTREFARELADRYGVAVDFAIHSPHGQKDVRNHHAHLLMTTRQVGAPGLGEKSLLERENKQLQAAGLPTSHEQLRDLRVSWEERTNAHLARAGLDIRVDHRSHRERGLEIEPTQHMGIHATQMARLEKPVSRARLDAAAARRNADLIREKPEQVLTLITGEKSVFDRRDVARALHRYIDDAESFQAAFAKVMASPALVELQAERRDEAGRVLEGARYSTREMVSIERDMALSADRMAARGGFGVAARRVEGAIAAHARNGICLTDEQQAAVRHLAGSERISAVVGLAGAGKSTMLAAARTAWEAEGYRVQGAALAGKAAEGLEESSSIPSRTLASWERGWERGFDRLTARDVFVIDEAGMVGSKQLSRFIQEADRAGAKVVLVGDPEQLQPIGPGAAFRAIAERVGFVELEEVRRQREDWQRAASIDFGRHRTVDGLAAYDERGAVRFEATAEQACAAIVRDVAADRAARPDGSRLVLAHRNADVQALNEAIRADRQRRGELTDERVYQTTEGARAFAPGDRVLFRENNRDLGVKNGMLGTVEKAEEDRLVVRLDSANGRPGQGRSVLVSMADYGAVDHGYATTIHKAQGATVDRAFVLASGTMDRHLTYVAMTRHRESVQLYASQDEFRDTEALTARLSRSQAKETTLDYANAQGPKFDKETNSERTFEEQRHRRVEEQDLAPFAARRGYAPQSEIIVSERDVSAAREARYQAGEPGWQAVQLLAQERQRDAERVPHSAAADRRAEPVQASLVERAQAAFETSRAASEAHRGTIGERFADRLAIRQAERALEARLPELAQEIGRQVERLERGAAAAEGLAARVAARVEARGVAAERAQERQRDAAQETGRAVSRDTEVPDIRESEVPTPGMSMRGMFDGLKLGTGRVAADGNIAGTERRPEGDRVQERSAEPRPAEEQLTQRDPFAGLRLSASAQEPSREQGRGDATEPSAPELTRAAERYARAWSDAERMRAQDLPVLEYQRKALRDAETTLEAARPGAVRDLQSALQHDPATREAMAKLQGRERGLRLVAGIEREGEVRRNPEIRAERLVKEWKGLEAERSRLRVWDQGDAWSKVDARMRSVAADLKRDPQLEAAVQRRQQEFGIKPGEGLDRMMREQEHSRSLERQRDRGLSLGR